MTSEGRGTNASSATDVEIAAAEWFGRQQFWSWTTEDQLKFDAWLNESLAHQVAYWRIVGAWHRSERLQAVGLHRPPSSAQSSNKNGRRIFRFVAAAAAVAAVVVAAVISAPQFASKGRVYTTGLGEHRTLVLADGSRIELNTNSVLRVNFAAGSRQVSLERGEAYFQIRHDPIHPFLVVTHDHRITDLGTKFLVRDSGPVLQVILYEGKAQLETLQENRGPRSAMLTPGDVAVATATSLKVTRRAPQTIANSLAWRSGLIVLGNHATLADAVAEFNRYNQIKLVIDDPSIAQTPVAGRFATNGVSRFADVVTHVFGLHVRTRGEAIVITR